MESDEEVRSKPVGHISARPRARQTESETQVTTDYYDMLVIGKTGMGKSSTVDKLLVPVKVVTRSDVAREQRQVERNKHLIPPAASITTLISQTDKQPISEDVGQETRDDITSSSELSQSVDEHRAKLQVKNKDMVAWVLCGDDTRKEQQTKAEHRIKNIGFARDIEKSHKEVHRLRILEPDLYVSTNSCELLANDKSKVRVLDTPGFHGAQHFEGATNTIDSDLSIVRKIVRIQALLGMRFRRVLYFLPEKGPLARADRIIQGEISQMVRYFGKSIFRCMVLITTVSKTFSNKESMSREEKFPPEDLESTREAFQEALVREFRERNKDVSDLPEPPILFIAMTDTCDDILKAVTSARVADDTGLRLEFSPNVCIRCSLNIGEKPGDDEKPLVCAFDQTWSEAILYDDSTCHPLMLPKYTLKSIGRGILHLFLLELCFSEEKCVECSKNPGTPGCKKVGGTYMCKKDSTEIIVDHSCKLDKQRRRSKVKTKKQTSTPIN